MKGGNIYFYVIDNKECVKATPDEIENQFRNRVLIYWFMIGNRFGLPKDLKWYIANLIPKNYHLHPIWEFIKKNRSIPNTKCLAIYKKTPLYDASDDPRAIKKRSCWVDHTLNRRFGYCYQHDETIVWLMNKNSSDHRRIEVGIVIINIEY